MLNIILLILLFVFIVLFICATMIARAQYLKSQQYEQMILQSNQLMEEFGNDVLETYNHIKAVDNKQMFEKDDDVGVIFQELVDIIEKFNERTQSNFRE